jgi:hypothetical protein
VVYFRKDDEAVRYKRFIIKYVQRFGTVPELNDYDDKASIIKSGDKFDQKQSLKTSKQEYDYTLDDIYHLGYDSYGKLEKDITVLHMEKKMLDIILSINNVGSIECEINKYDKIERLGEEKRVLCCQKDYIDYLEMLYKEI